MISHDKFKAHEKWSLKRIFSFSVNGEDILILIRVNYRNHSECQFHPGQQSRTSGRNRLFLGFCLGSCETH